MEFNQLHYTYGKRFCLCVDALCLPDRQITAVLGPNGSGKSTLLKLLAGLLPNESEYVRLTATGYLPQQSVAFDRTVLQNVQTALWDVPRKLRKQKAEQALTDTDLQSLSGARATQLSGGETQRLALSRVLAREPQILLLDEPTAACDLESEKKIEDALRQFRGTVLFSTHSPAQALRLADRVLFMDGGTLLEEGSTQDVLFHPQHPRVQEFMQHWRVQTDASSHLHAGS